MHVRHDPANGGGNKQNNAQLHPFALPSRRPPGCLGWALLQATGRGKRKARSMRDSQERAWPASLDLRTILRCGAARLLCATSSCAPLGAMRRMSQSPRAQSCWGNLVGACLRFHARLHGRVEGCAAPCAALMHRAALHRRPSGAPDRLSPGSIGGRLQRASLLYLCRRIYLGKPCGCDNLCKSTWSPSSKQAESPPAGDVLQTSGSGVRAEGASLVERGTCPAYALDH